MLDDRQVTISIFTGDDIANQIGELGALLHTCVHDGASIGFVLPFTPDDSEAFWRTKVLPGVLTGTRVLLVAQAGKQIAGSVQLGYDTFPNQRHRADVSKLLVHPQSRRRGLARALMAELEDLARRLGRTLLTLDTRTGDSAEPLYASLGYQTAGVIPGYCRHPFEDRLDSTTIMYKVL
jgi:ribosomal protein S18 acetylase RimI-like enzyme